MNFYSLLYVEAKRQFHNRATWILMALTILSPVAGYTFYRPVFGDSMTSLYLANPMIAGGVAGCLLFSVCMMFSLDHPKRSGISPLTDAMVSPSVIHTVRLTAVLILALFTSLAVGILYLPYTVWKLDIVFSWSDYCLAVCLIFLSGPVMGVLFSGAVYQLTERTDVSLAAVLAFLIFSRTVRAGSFLWQWSVPLVPALSDAFGSSLVWRTAFYSRVIWLALLGGLWGFSLLCVRQYGRGAAGSFLWQMRQRPWKLVSALLLMAAGGVFWQIQPFIDHSPADWMTAEKTSRYNENLTLMGTDLTLWTDSYLFGILSGKAVFQIKNTSGKTQELYFELNPGYHVRSLTANKTPLAWEDLQNDYIASRELHCTLPADADITLEISYKGSPKIWNARESFLDGSVISAQNMNLMAARMAPTVLNCVDVDENAPASLTAVLKKGMTMVTSGSTRMVKDNGDGTCEWRAESVGTDRFYLYAGDYVELKLGGSGMPVQFYYSKKYQERLEGMGAIDMMERVIEYCAGHYGPRTFTAKEPFKIVQMTVFSFGGFANNNISGMGETYFSDRNLRDPEKGAASAEVLAHEIVHQWWGLGAGLMDPEDMYWSDEGITTYTTYRIMCEQKGKEYAYENYVKKWMEDVESNSKNFYLRHPEYRNRLPASYANEILAACQAVNWYSGNALMMYRASELLGEEEVDRIWSELYAKCQMGELPFITKKDFLDACGLDEEVIGRE